MYIIQIILTSVKVTAALGIFSENQMGFQLTCHLVLMSLQLLSPNWIYRHLWPRYTSRLPNPYFPICPSKYHNPSSFQDQCPYLKIQLYESPGKFGIFRYDSLFPQARAQSQKATKVHQPAHIELSR